MSLQKLEIVGKGAYGAVYRGRHLPTGHVVALKIINLDTEDDDVGDIQKEIALLQQLMTGAAGGTGVTPNVIKYYGSLMEGPKVWIIMEYAEGGSIRTLVRHDVRLNALKLIHAVEGPASKGAPHLSDTEGGFGRLGLPPQEWRYPS